MQSIIINRTSHFQAVHTFLSWGSRVESLPSPRCCHCQQYQAFVIFSSKLWFYQREHTGVSINLFTVSASKASNWALNTQSQLSQTSKMVRRQWRTRVYVDLAAKRGGSLPIALVGVEISSRQCLPNWFAWFMVLVCYLLIIMLLNIRIDKNKKHHILISRWGALGWFYQPAAIFGQLLPETFAKAERLISLLPKI